MTKALLLNYCSKLSSDIVSETWALAVESNRCCFVPDSRIQIRYESKCNLSQVIEQGNNSLWLSIVNNLIIEKYRWWRYCFLSDLIGGLLGRKLSWLGLIKVVTAGFGRRGREGSKIAHFIKGLLVLKQFCMPVLTSLWLASDIRTCCIDLGCSVKYWVNSVKITNKTVRSHTSNALGFVSSLPPISWLYPARIELRIVNNYLNHCNILKFQHLYIVFHTSLHLFSL